jgi:DNA primase
VVTDPTHPRTGWIALKVVDILGRTRGWAYRRVEPHAGPRWSLGPGFPRGRHLYNLDLAWPSLASSHVAILVEGPFDALHLQQGGWPNTVGLLGNRVTGWHVELLLTVGVETVVLLLDNDHGGRQGRRWALDQDRRLEPFQVVDLLGSLPRGRDPDELPHTELARFLDPFRPL